MSDDQDELRDLRNTVEELGRRLGAGFREDLAQIRAIVSAAAERDVTDDVRALRTEVAALAARLDDDSARAQVLARFEALEDKLDAAGAGGSAAAERVEQLLETIERRLDGMATADQVAQVVEQLQDHLADVASGEVVGALWDEVRAVRDALDGFAGPAGGSAAEVSQVLDSLATLHDELAAVRRGVGDIRDRLEDGTVSDGDEAPGGAGDVDVLADQIAGLRDLVSSEIDGLRQVLADRPGPPDQQPQALPMAVPAGPVALDDATLDVLRDEIRAAGAVGDQVLDALREELKALRRRIAVKAAERVLDDDQLAQIADAVAARLAKG